jgi:ATP-dependent Clp protease protease subunit
MPKQFWTVRNLSNLKGEIVLYGVISEELWWGDEVTPKQFLSDVYAMGAVNEIDVRINSGGGDVFAAHTIANYLKAHAAKINVYIDGLCASAATIIAMAGDVIKIPTTAMMMIHDPMAGLMGYYNKAELEKVINVMEQIKVSIMESYKAKTSLSDEELYTLMENETWLTGKEAVEKGFADELLYDNVDFQIENALNGRFLVVNNVKFAASSYKNMPQIHEKQHKSEPKNNAEILPKVEFSNKNQGDKVLTLEEFKNQHPDLFKEVVNSGVTQERERIKSIENVAMPGYADMVNKAKFETIIDAGQLSINMIQAQKDKGKQVLNGIKNDAEDLELTPESTKTTDETSKEKLDAAVNMIAGFMKKGAK